MAIWVSNNPGWDLPALNKEADTKEDTKEEDTKDDLLDLLDF